MKLIIKINLDNAAFEYQPGTEIANLLEQLAGRFWGVLPPALDSIPPTIKDSNGNKVGSVEVVE